MAGMLQRWKSRFGKLSERMDRYQEAITFAEAGQPGQVTQDHERGTEQEQRGKLLVVGRESVFSPEVMEYALDMAGRLSYEIVALNTAPLTCEVFNLLPAERSKVCQEFMNLAKANSRQFEQEAQKRGIPFTQVIKFRERDQALAEITREFRDIEFVISDDEQQRSEQRPVNDNRPKKEIYVYSII